MFIDKRARLVLELLGMAADRQSNLELLPTSRTLQYCHFNAHLGNPDWTRKKILDFGGNVGDNVVQNIMRRRRMNIRSDGGPTSWNGYVVPKDPTESYREFMLEFLDMQLAYLKCRRVRLNR